MEAERIRQMRLADPFRPFNLVLLDGRRLPVDKPYYLGMSLDGKIVFHSSLNGGCEKLSPAWVQEIEPLPLDPSQTVPENGKHP
jgi:hypothetical protein